MLRRMSFIHADSSIFQVIGWQKSKRTRYIWDHHHHHHRWIANLIFHDRKQSRIIFSRNILWHKKNIKQVSNLWWQPSYTFLNEYQIIFTCMSPGFLWAKEYEKKKNNGKNIERDFPEIINYSYTTNLIWFDLRLRLLNIRKSKREKRTKWIKKKKKAWEMWFIPDDEWVCKHRTNPMIIMATVHHIQRHSIFIYRHRVSAHKHKTLALASKYMRKNKSIKLPLINSYTRNTRIP